MRKNFILFLFIFALFSHPESVFATEITSTTKYNELTSQELATYFVQYYNCNNFVLFQNSSYYYFLPLYNDSKVIVKNNNGTLTSFIYFNSYNSAQITYYAFRITKTSIIERYPILQNNYTSFNLASNNGENILLTTFDIINTDNDSVFFTKNYNYSPPTCEECEECEECDSMNINFPISKEEFYVLLVLVAVLILLIFFKWCFPMNRRK